LFFVCEIEESDRTPIRIYGKFFTLISSEYCKTKHKKSQIPTEFPFANECIFLQIVSNKNWTAKSKKGTNLSKKIPQLAEIQKSIENTLKACLNSRFEYHLIHCDIPDFIPKNSNIEIEIEKLLAKL